MPRLCLLFLTLFTSISFGNIDQGRTPPGSKLGELHDINLYEWESLPTEKWKGTDQKSVPFTHTIDNDSRSTNKPDDVGME